MADLAITKKIRLSPKQRCVLEFRAPLKDNEPQIEIVGILGDFGGGKSFIAAMRFLIGCLENPFEPAVHSGGDEPLSAMVAPTAGDLKKGPLVQFMKVCPEELIYKTRFYGEYQDFQLVNGHRVLLYSAEGAKNGPTLCQMWPDEIQEKVYEGQWDNLQGRVRDKRARRLNVQASGIAQRGHVEEIFRRPNTENRLTVLLYPEDNAANMAQGYVHEMKASLPASRERDPDGWLIVHGAMFPKFSRERNVRMPPGMEKVHLDALRGNATSFAVDFGRKAVAIFGQPTTALVKSAIIGPDGRPLLKPAPALLLVDQLMPDNMDAEELAALIRRDAQWKIEPGKSFICLDPTAEPDQVRHFRRAFPGVEIIQIKRGFYHLEENGIRAVDRAVLDGNKDVRLFVHPSMTPHPSGRGVVEMFSSHLAAKPKDKKLEHACDGVRYLTQKFLPLPNQPLLASDEDEEKMYEKTRPVAAGLKASDL